MRSKSREDIVRLPWLYAILTALIVAIGLYQYRTSYWGDNGFGDHKRIPLNNNYSLDHLEGMRTVVNGKDYISQTIDSLVWAEDYILFKELEEDGSNYYMLKIDEDQFEEINQTQFNSKTKGMKPKDFNFYYDQYWTIWKTFLVP